MCDETVGEIQCYRRTEPTADRSTACHAVAADKDIFQITVSIQCINVWPDILVIQSMDTFLQFQYIAGFNEGITSRCSVK